MALNVTTMLAARMPAIPTTPPPKRLDPIEAAEAAYRAEPLASKFTGPPNATLWLGGKKTGKRFSTNGVYITSDELEKAELRKTYGIREVIKVAPIGDGV